jgi:hypothetical protein
MDFIAGSDVSLQFHLETKLGTSIPDADSVTYSVRNNSGDLIVTDQAISTSDTQTSVVVLVSASDNAITAPALFEKRWVQVVWTQGGNTYRMVKIYRLVPFLNHTVSPDDVRAFLGMDEDELRDDEVDLTAAYYEFNSLLNTGELETALTAGNLSTIRANDAIVATCALRLIPSLELRPLSKQTDGSLTNQRFDRVKPDYDKLAQAAQGLITLALASISNTDEVVPALVSLTTGTDAITGA